MKTHTLIILIFSLLLLSCKKNDMDKTIFIPDEDDPILPAYTEWGYNSFGAEYERDYFLVSHKIVPNKITYSNQQLQFLLHGTTNYTGKEMKLLFVFNSEQISELEDFRKLHQKEIDLSTNECTVKIDNTVLEVTEGKLHFKRVQLLIIDNEPMERVILSGTFDLNFMQKGFQTSISNGRFDLGITKKNFSGQ